MFFPEFGSPLTLVFSLIFLPHYRYRVPSASLVLIITAYNTVFNTTGTPDGFSFILAVDWFMDRLRTVLNVTGDGVVAGMVASLCPIDEETTLERPKDIDGSADDSDEPTKEQIAAVVD
jgi:Na+/H+-dicarboxylate symporter